MTPEEKQLLLQDLCARLPYGVKVENTSYSEPQVHTLFGKVSDDLFLMLETYKSVGGEDYRRVTDDVHYTGFLETIKPYLRPMSSMTKEERKELSNYKNSVQRTDFFYSYHIDCRFMIEKGLAIEAPEDMYQ